jgi:signal transduction histidine kinase/streptogramin lyase
MEDPDKGFIHFKDDPENSKSIGNNQIWAIAENNDEEIWIGTDNGLALFQEKDKSFIVYRNDSFDPKSLVANSVKSLHVDKQNRLWVGSYNNGVCMFDKQFIQMGHYYRKQNGHSLSYNDVSAFLEIDKDIVLIGTDGGGLNIFNRNTKEFLSFQYDPKNSKSIGGNKIKAMLLDSKKRIWITFWGAGMDLFDLDKKVFTHFRKGTADSLEELNNENVTCITEDQDGILWLGTFGGGLNKFDPESRTFKFFDQNIRHAFALGDTYIWSLLSDRENNVWAGTSNGKLYKLDYERKQFMEFPLKKANEDGYSIMALYEDSKGRIWVGLEGGGLKMLDKGKLTSETLTHGDGLPSNNINAIEEDRNGNLWISTNHGIIRYNPENKKIKAFEISDGLQGLNFNRQASAVLSTGEILFGGNNGFNMFYPDKLKDRQIKTRLIFSDFQIFNRPVPIGKDDSPLKFQINKTSSITLSYKHTVFSIEYAALNYSAPEKTKYKYRLRGFTDESWQKVGNVRKATYTNLDPGKYVFEVALDETGKSLAPMRSLAIVVEPPWWQTGLARVFFILTCSSLLFLIYYVRSRNIIIQNKKLEKEVDKRTQQLTEANVELRELNKLIQEQKEEIESQASELAESNEEIKAINHQLEERVEMRTSDLRKTNQELDNFVYRVSHDIRAPLSSILGLVALIEKESNPQITNTYLKMVTKSVNKLDSFVKDILDYSRNSRMEVVHKVIDFKELIDSTTEELQYMENAHRLKILSELDIRFPHYNDGRRLHIVLRNLFSNAIKYQNLRNEESYLIINVVSDKEGATITISDNGIGIDKPQLEKVFDMFYRGSDKSTGSGLGLYIVKEAVEKLDGTIDIQSDIGSGAIFKIYLPNIITEVQD